MREEFFRKLKARLGMLCVNAAGEYYILPEDADAVDDGLHERAVKTVDLWNHNVEFIEQEVPWQCPAVFVEYGDLEWREWLSGEEYRAPATINLHVVTEWDPECGIGQFRLLDKIHETVMGLSGDKFVELDIQSSQTNHNHEQLVENIETYKCVARRLILS